MKRPDVPTAPNWSPDNNDGASLRHSLKASLLPEGELGRTFATTSKAVITDKLVSMGVLSSTGPVPEDQQLQLAS